MTSTNFYSREYRGLLERDDNHLKLNISKTNKLVLGYDASNMDEVAGKTASKKHVEPRSAAQIWNMTTFALQLLSYGVE